MSTTAKKNNIKKRSASAPAADEPSAKRAKSHEPEALDDSTPTVRKMKNPLRAPISQERLNFASNVPPLAFDSSDISPLASAQSKVHAETFMTDHVVVFPVFTEQELAAIRPRLELIVANSPEFRDNSSLIRSMAALGALGTASSFHHPELRALRSNVAGRSRAVLAEIGRRLKHGFVHELMDRLSFRPAVDAAAVAASSKNSEHSDNAPRGTGELADDIAGSIVNLNDEVIHFSCRKGTGVFGADLVSHTKKAKSGFRRVATENDEVGEPKSPLIKVAIPPGHRCVFLQTILHAIAGSNCAPATAAGNQLGQWRLYQGVHWGDCDAPYFGYNYFLDVISVQSAPLLPSGECPNLVESNYLRFWPEDVADFTETLIPELHSKHSTKISKRSLPFQSMCVHKSLDRFAEKQAKLDPKKRSERAHAELHPNMNLLPSLAVIGAEYPDWKKAEYRHFVPRIVLPESELGKQDSEIEICLSDSEEDEQ